MKTFDNEIVNGQTLKLTLFFFGAGIVRLQDQENDPETKKIIQKAIHDPFHFKKTEQETKTDKSLVVAQEKNLDEFTLPHPIWSNEEVFCYYLLSILSK